MNVAYVTTGDPSSVTAWSGLFYYIARALNAQSIDVDPIGPLERRYESFFKGKEAIFRYLLGRRHPRDREPFIAKHFARQVRALLGPEHDFVFSVGTLPIACLECEQPIVVWSDATFAAIVDFYPVYTNVSSETLRNGNALEAAALQRSRLVIYSSDWAAESAIRDYGIDRERVFVVPFGANVDGDFNEEDAERAIASRLEQICRLLFVGVEWERKGGPRAVEIAAKLNESGLPTELDVVGPWPRGVEAPSFVNRVGFVDKSSHEGRATMRRLLARSHFLLLPAKADCSPVVLNEAAAHALPALATDVGGIPSIVRDGVNGKLFARDAGAAEYSAYIHDVVSSPDRYRRLALSSLDEYHRRLNWRVAGASVRRLVEEALRP